MNMTLSAELDDELRQTDGELTRLRIDNKRMTEACKNAKLAIERAMITSTHDRQWKHISEAHSILILAVDALHPAEEERNDQPQDVTTTGNSTQDNEVTK